MKKVADKIINFGLKLAGVIELASACCILYLREPVTQNWVVAFATSLLLGWLFLVMRIEPSDKNT